MTTLSPEGTPFPTAFAQRVAAHPDKPAVITAARTVTFAELDERSTRLAHAYAELGVEAGRMVTIALPNDIEFFEATWATWKLGAIPQPISSRLPAVERDAIVELADAALVAGVPTGAIPGRTSVPPGFEPSMGTPAPPLPPRVAPAWKAPTSGGSTGRPKLIVAGDPALAESVQPISDVFLLAPGEVQLVPGPLYHNAPFLFAMAGTLLGNTQVVLDRFDAEEALRRIAEHRVTWVFVVPTMMQRIWRLPVEVRDGYDVTSLQYVWHGAAPCPPWLKHAWIDWLGPEKVLELYGGTEGQALTIVDGKEWLAHPGTVGKPLLGELRILDEDGNDVPPGTVGEVWMRRGEDAPATYRYVGAEARTLGAGSWESLGDMGRLDAEGYLYLADRSSDMILVGGGNVYPAEIEAALDDHPCVLSSCVIGLPHEDLGNVPHAIIEVSEPVSDDELLAHLRDRLAGYKIPRSFERATEPLRDDAGKVRRSALRAARVTS